MDREQLEQRAAQAAFDEEIRSAEAIRERNRRTDAGIQEVLNAAVKRDEVPQGTMGRIAEEARSLDADAAEVRALRIKEDLAQEEAAILYRLYIEHQDKYQALVRERNQKEARLKDRLANVIKGA